MLQFTADQWNLADGLQQVIGAVEKKNTMPILSRVLVSSNGSGITLRATDLEVSVETHVEASVKDSGSVAIPGAALLEYVRRLSGEIAVKVTPTYRAMVSAGSSKSNIASNEASAFPDAAPVPNEVSCRVKGSDMLRMIAETVYVIEKQALGVVNGCFLSLEGNTLSMMTKSATRLAISKSNVDGFKDGRWAIGERAISELKKLAVADEVEILDGVNSLFFRAGESVLSVRLLAVLMPDVSRVLAADLPHKIVVDRKQFRAALDRVSPFSVDPLKMSVVHMAVSGESMTLTGASLDLGDVEEVLPVKYEGPGLTAKYKMQFLADPLGAIEGDMVILRHNPEHQGNVRIGGESDTMTYFCADLRGK